MYNFSTKKNILFSFILSCFVCVCMQLCVCAYIFRICLPEDTVFFPSNLLDSNVCKKNLHFLNIRLNVVLFFQKNGNLSFTLFFFSLIIWIIWMHIVWFCILKFQIFFHRVEILEGIFARSNTCILHSFSIYLWNLILQFVLFFVCIYTLRLLTHFISLFLVLYPSTCFYFTLFISYSLNILEFFVIVVTLCLFSYCSIVKLIVDLFYSNVLCIHFIDVLKYSFSFHNN